ncbi:Thioredoxin domain-containing protein [Spironucleus salmonicida]|uniref:Thioredoxin domain-containing protein n=1 Tax=Spironucleus salmonicida TaxID=348837 RepID=V6LL02_9EUKA|nr:Thioredoxin domain-containing protein [Spironucleus salmonicida]|eukprot:EST45043.1 Thioredoxin domain-containing protein [Spironucleus salmonicida]
MLITLSIVLDFSRYHDMQIEDVQNKILLIKFAPSWCIGCENFNSLYNNLSFQNEYKHIIFSQIYCVENQDICDRYNIVQLPSVIRLYQGISELCTDLKNFEECIH